MKYTLRQPGSTAWADGLDARAAVEEYRRAPVDGLRIYTVVAGRLEDVTDALLAAASDTVALRAALALADDFDALRADVVALAEAGLQEGGAPVDALREIAARCRRPALGLRS